MRQGKRGSARPPQQTAEPRILVMRRVPYSRGGAPVFPPNLPPPLSPESTQQIRSTPAKASLRSGSRGHACHAQALQSCGGQPRSARRLRQAKGQAERGSSAASPPRLLASLASSNLSVI